MLGLPVRSGTKWGRIVLRLEEYVTELTKWSCVQVRQELSRVMESNGLLLLTFLPNTGTTTQTTPQPVYVTTSLGRFLTLPIAPNGGLVVIGVGLQEEQRQIAGRPFGTSTTRWNCVEGKDCRQGHIHQFDSLSTLP